MGKLFTVFFSATDTTRRSVHFICQGLGAQADTSINIADLKEISFPDLSADDVVVVASPVYSGRLPGEVSDALKHLHGNNAVSIAVAVFGNRDYDDALLELTDILRDNGFRIAGAGAFIGQHSIFPKVGKARPDHSDEQLLIRFGRECKDAIEHGFNPQTLPLIKGHRPYKKAMKVPLFPKTDVTKCIKCGKCASGCPVKAITDKHPYVTDSSRCISCGRCINQCPEGARKHSGIGYAIIGAAFKALFSRRKEPEWVIAR